MPQDGPFHALASEDDLQDALRRSDDEPVVLYKHSSTCPISAQAQDEMKSLLSDSSSPPIYELVVQDSRNVSDRIAEHFSIQHETPQAIVVSDGEPVFNASHHDVTAASVSQAAA